MTTIIFPLHKSLVVFFVGLFFVSCTLTTAHIEEKKYLDTTSLSGIHNVAVLVKIYPPEVIDSQTEFSTWNPILFGLAGALVEGSIREDKDKSHAEKVSDNINLSLHEKKLAQTFIKTLKESGRFKTIEYMKDNKQLSSERYRAVINLIVNKLTLKKMSNDNVRLSANILGKMVDLKTSQTIWNRDDSIIASEGHTIDFYEKYGLQELDTLLEKGGKKLGYDFLYLK